MEQGDGKKAALELKMFLTTIILLGVLIIIAGSASYFIQAGEFVETEINGEIERAYRVVDQKSVPVWKIMLSPLMSLTGEHRIKIIVIIFFIFTIGGSFSILNRSGILPRLLSDLVKRFASQKELFLVINILIFSLLGSCLGILEEIAPLILIFVPLAFRMGWDSITGIAIPFVSAGFGFAAATFNPFTIGMAQKLADVPLFSGLILRIPVFLITTMFLIAYMLYYTKKIENDPSKSITFETDKKLQQTENVVMHEGNVTPALVWMGLCFLGIVGIVLGGSAVPILQEAAFPLIALVFLIMGIGVGLLSGKGIKETFNYFFQGISDFSPAIILILMAAAVSYLIMEGNVMDTILHTISQRAQGYSAEVSVLMIYGFQMFMNFFVPGGSGQAMLTIPILAPLGDLIGLTRQTIVLAFQFGDGFSNLIWPTNPLLLIAIGLAGVSYKDWLKWVLPIEIILALVCTIFLIIAVNINYV